jgi:O-6-methylguanine DNA methyltransferase
MPNSAPVAGESMNHLQFRVEVGTIAVTWNSEGRLTRIDWYPGAGVPASVPPSAEDPTWAVLSRTDLPQRLSVFLRSLRAFFISGEPLGEVPWDLLSLAGCSEFQQKVFRAISLIPHGETRTYAWVARRIGKLSPRAVGQALKRNPFPIVLPCHRVVGTGDALGGFMGSAHPEDPELRLKKWLLDLENNYLNPPFAFLSSDFRLSSA